MFGSFRKHQKWIWILGIIIIIPSFVIFFTPDVDLTFSGRDDSYDFGSIDGRKINRQEFGDALKQVRLAYFFNSGGTWPGSDEATQSQLENDVMIRLMLQRKLEEYEIEVSEKAVARLIKSQLGDLPIQDFVNERLAPQGLIVDDYVAYLTYQAGIMQLIPVAGISGRLVNPSEARTLFGKENENIHVEAVGFWISNYLDTITVDAASLGRFYTNRLALYREPDRMVVNYVEFSASNFLSQADQEIAANTNLAQNIDEFYRQRGADSFKDTNDVVKTEEEAKAEIRDDLRMSLALRAAQRQANDFGNALLELPQPNKAEDLLTVATNQILEVKSTQPFGRTDTLEETKLDANFRQQALRLTAATPIQVNPVVGENAVYMIALKEEIKGATPNLDQITDKVTEDYKSDQARNLARANGNSFLARLTNGLAAAKSFETICEEAMVTPVAIPAFSPSTRPPLEGLDERFNLTMIQRTIESLEEGQASSFLPARDGGYVLYYKGRSPVTEEKVQAELEEYTANLRQYRLSQAFNQWVRKQMETQNLVMPNRGAQEVAPDTDSGAAPPPPPPSGS